LLIEKARSEAPDGADLFVGIEHDGDRIVTMRAFEDIVTFENPREACRRHILRVLHAFGLDLTDNFASVMSEMTTRLPAQQNGGWVDPYTYPLVTEDEEQAIDWMTT